MKRALVCIALSILVLSGCGNRTIVDTHYTFTKALIDGIGEIEVKEWIDYEDSDMVQVKDNNGIVYLTHSSRVILMSE